MPVLSCIHRIAIVNEARIAEISLFASGDGELTLNTDAVVPVSRRFRQQLRDVVVGDRCVTDGVLSA